jgi:hypothetical protein
MIKANLFAKAIIATTALALAGGPLAAAPRMTPQQELDKALKGRVAGKPVNCIDPRSNDQTRIIDKTAIVYGSGRTIYVQRPNGAESLTGDPILVTTLRGTNQLCSIEVVQLLDRSTRFNRGFVTLNSFVPYTRVATRD